MTLEVVQDRLRAGTAERGRVLESLEAALRVGRGRVNVHVVDDADPPQRLDTLALLERAALRGLRSLLPRPDARACSRSTRRSGACETCRGFGRIIGIDYGLVIPDETKTLRGGAIKPWQTKSYTECQDDLVKFAKQRGIPLDTPWRELSSEAAQVGDRGRRRVGEEGLVRRASASSRGSRPTPTRCTCACCCRATAPTRPAPPATARASSPRRCCGASATSALADAALGAAPRFRPARASSGAPRQLAALPGLSIHDLMLLPMERSHAFFQQARSCRRRSMRPPICCSGRSARASATSRDVGLGYLTLDRQSRTLSGGEVQRINLTTALGTSLVNTLFVLDEPSIGLHPRDMQRVIGVMKRLRDAGNSLVVVEHDPQIMLEADRILDLGPGAGERGGEIVFFGTPAGDPRAPARRSPAST